MLMVILQVAALIHVVVNIIFYWPALAGPTRDNEYTELELPGPGQPKCNSDITRPRPDVPTG
ncbi:hypothetical protein A2U01_0064668, partial [Trifolium medium]|nr:hypothetical protein [Trifolium medium]